jgi:hypothetical protein
MPPTQAVESDLGNRMLPALLIVGLVGLAITRGIRFFVQPPRGPNP